jgi:hypothetical protein
MTALTWKFQPQKADFLSNGYFSLAETVRLVTLICVWTQQ